MRPFLSFPFSFCHCLGLLVLTHSIYAVTVYPTEGIAPTTSLVPGAPYHGPAAYNPVTLNIPAAPTNFPTQYSIHISNGAAPPGISIPHFSSFFGFSIEMSVVDQVLGLSSQLINVPFLNLMANIIRRSGRVNLRVGGNTQETAVMVQNTTSGRLIEKDYGNTLGTTKSPALEYKEDLFYLMSNISNSLNVRWFLGIPFNKTNPFQLDIAEKGQAILGDRLIGLQAGNEPDFYAMFNKRPANYTVWDYYNDVGNLTSQMNNNPQITNRSMLLAPSVATGMWAPEVVWNTGFIQAYSKYLAYLSVEHYPTDNCAAHFGAGAVNNPETELPTYLTHESGVNLVAPYINSTNIAQQNGKPFVMFETNTASCGGFSGLSDAFVAALWALDYGLQMAYANFSMALFHVGGQNDSYNPFTAPPRNQSSYHEWTIGPIYYAALVMAETLSNGSQVLDITTSANLSDQSPAYLIYENGSPARIALFNYVTDPSNGHNVNFTFSFDDPSPTQVQVKYLRASSVTQKGNYNWAGQTFGGYFESDGCPIGQESIETVQCSGRSCSVILYAPSYALVFLDNNALVGFGSGPSATFSTSAVTNTRTLTVDSIVLATSNGNRGLFDFGHLGATSRGSLVNGATGVMHTSCDAILLACIAVASMILLREAA
ncbi:hypothetical protein AX15_006082 [Amanita polypyramis BW_CC]|nr:hypothetical protein AX15_006082 [Amanita polypyramis BW_CC]